MKPQGLRVFLSYAQRDDKPAQALRAELEKGGFEVWDPVAKLSPGDNWALEQGKALKDAEAIIVLLSPVALASENVKREIDYALARLYHPQGGKEPPGRCWSGGAGLRSV